MIFAMAIKVTIISAITAVITTRRKLSATNLDPDRVVFSRMAAVHLLVVRL